MFKISWDKETGGVQLSSKTESDTLGISPGPVFFEELDLLKLDELGWKYPRTTEPLMWACNKQYFYHGELMFEAKDANIYSPALIIFQKGKEKMTIAPVDVKSTLNRCKNELFLLETEALEFIRDVYIQYVDASKKVDTIKSNQLNFEVLAEQTSKKRKQQMAIVKLDCDSFDIMPLEEAKNSGKRIYATTKIDKFIASFSGGKDSQVVLDLCTRAIPPQAFDVIYSDTGYELPSSLRLYEQIKQHYQTLYPELSFRIARNHEKVLKYWDKIGIPSDSHRWCCSIMKTVPLYRMLKIEGTNKQAKVLAFEGTRGEESARRSKYERIGKGVKHNNVINARPIIYWNTTEVFLYLMQQNLPLNKAYRVGKPRVGCLICPFSSEWDDMIVNTCYHEELKPFLNRIENWAKERDIPNMNEYIQNHSWKLRASGKYMNSNRKVEFSEDKNNLIGHTENSATEIETWLPILGFCYFNKKKDTVLGELKIKQSIYSFKITPNEKKGFDFYFFDIHDVFIIGDLKRIIYKTTYCIQCEACEVECPTGALSIYPQINIDKLKCTHCHKCIDFHTKGCITADSLNMAQTEKTKLTGISGYGTFGLRSVWLSEYFRNQNDFWNTNSLGSKQVPSFKTWLKDSEIIDYKGNITTFGQKLSEIYLDNSILVWEIIWINLAHKSTLLKWFIEKVEINSNYSKSTLTAFYNNEYSEGKTTFEYAVGALFNFLSATPIGMDCRQKICTNKNEYKREKYSNLSREAIAYSLYKYAEEQGIKSLRVSDLYKKECKSGPYCEFGIDKENLEKALRSLNSQNNRVLTAELNMGLDHILLREDLNALSALNLLIK
jgi:3'-phosphoadenosine 5'-phosphosulfate sulfotransferase (PAPS reductase)/FAD synthetase/ferredoxin